MTLDDLLIHSDWLEENYIVNNLYKLYLNLLRIKLRKNNDYLIGYTGDGSRHNFTERECFYGIEGGDGRGHGMNGDYTGNCNFIVQKFGDGSPYEYGFEGTGFGYGRLIYGFYDGEGVSI